MPSNAFSITTRGFGACADAFKQLPYRVARKILPKALNKGGRVLAKVASRNAPVLDTSKRGGKWMLKPPPKRISGLVRRSLRVMPSKLRRSEGNVGVFVTVSRVALRRTRGESSEAFRTRKRTAVSRRKEGMFTYLYTPRGGKKLVAGAVYRPNDPFYFKFLEKPKNHIKTNEYQFITPAYRSSGDQVLGTVVEETAKAIQGLKASTP